MVIGGFTKNDNTSKIFSALLVGVFNNGQLQYTGKVGTGFNHKTQQEMMAAFEKLITGTPPSPKYRISTSLRDLGLTHPMQQLPG